MKRRKIKSYRDPTYRQFYQNLFPTKKLTKRQRYIYKKLFRRFSSLWVDKRL